MGAHLRNALSIVRESAFEFSKDRVPQLSAAVAYYTIFSLAPILVLSISLAGIFFGERAARGEIVGTIDDLVGPVAAEQIETMIDEAGREDGGVMATVLGLAALLFGASGVFYQLSLAMNQIWDISKEDKGGVRGMVKNRFAAFAIVLSVGFLLLTSLVVSASLAAFGRILENSVGIGGGWQVADVAISFTIITVLFAFLFRYLPDTRVEWRWVWAGAALTSLLFAIGKYALGLYLGRSSVGSTFGAAGSLAVVLIWIYFSATVFFFGAEITEVMSRRERSRQRDGPREKSGRRVETEVTGHAAAGVQRAHGMSRGGLAVGAASAGMGCLAGVAAVVIGAFAGLLAALRRVFRR